jgi:hypothetical protein
MRRGLALLIAGVVGASFAANAGDEATPSFTQALHEARSSLMLKDGHLAGEGARALSKAIARARYVALGEDHLTHEIPQFAAAVCDAMAPQGLDALAVETGREVSQVVAPKLADGTASAAISALINKYPDSVAFLNMHDEIDLATHCAKAGGPAFKFWGLDQEFIGSAGWLLDLIKQQHLTPKAEAKIRFLQAEEQRDAEAAARTGDPAALFLFQVDDRELVETREVLKADGNQAANTIFDELVLSHTIYASHKANRDGSNHARALLLKETFLHDLEDLDNARKPPRVLLKFGESHLYKGINPLRQRDLGNFVAELADGQGANSLHIAVLGVRGTHRLYAGYRRPTRLEPFTLDLDDDYTWLKPAFADLMSPGWTEFDLRGLRFRKLRGLGPEWERMIYGYDFLILVPELTPADPL